MNRTVVDIQSYLYQTARERPQRPVEGLMRLIADTSVIEAAWQSVRKSNGARTPGADHIEAGALAEDPRELRRWLQSLSHELQSGRYHPGPVRRFEVAKPGKPDATRPIAILTLADRVVHSALKLILEPIIEARLGKRCFGFRPGRNRFDQLHSVRRIVRDHDGSLTAALTSDIASCFDQIDHRLLIEDFRAIASEASVHSLAGTILEQVGSGLRGWWRHRRVGVLQGSPLSPLLANWNLARLDRAWDRRVGDPAPLFRYADDLLILATNARAAARLRGELEDCLWRSTRLELSSEKTIVRTFDEGVPSLGMMLRSEQDPFDGGSKVRVLLDPRRVRELLAEVEHWASHLDPDRPLGRQFDRFNARLRGWFGAYQYAHDSSLAFSTIDECVFRAVRQGLKTVLGCSSATLQERHYHTTPTGHQTWKADGVPILVLNSLARQYYRARSHRSPWERAASPSAQSPVPSVRNELSRMLQLAGVQVDPSDPSSPASLRGVKSSDVHDVFMLDEEGQEIVAPSAMGESDLITIVTTAEDPT